MSNQHFISLQSNIQVFDDTKPIITSCADGYVCIIAYGQTGAGKTYSHTRAHLKTLERTWGKGSKREKES